MPFEWHEILQCNFWNKLLFQQPKTGMFFFFKKKHICDSCVPQK